MTHPLRGPHRLKLGLFAMNADGGLAITTVPERWRAGWAENLAVARAADAAGLDFLLPIARWAGFGGETRAREWSFETFAWASALAASTERIAIFATVHVPLVHPVFAAKALATLDHVSGGRAGLNIVCGWNPVEFAMFGATPDPLPYDRAAEWIGVVEQAWGPEAPVDVEGAFYRLGGVISRPGPVQRPRPVTMNAAFGDPGRDFAARHVDFLFSTFTDIEDGRRHLGDIRGRAAAAGREVGAYTVAHVVCRASQAEAEDYYDRYARDLADHAAVDAHMAGKKQFSRSHDPVAFDAYRQRFAGGAGTYPLVGTPQRVAETLAAIAAEGWEGVALSFVDFAAEVPPFCAAVLPLLRAAGLRAN